MSYITFPIELEFKQLGYPYEARSYAKKVLNVARRYKDIVNSVPLRCSKNYGILTGAKSGITVIDVDYDPEFKFECPLDRSITKTVRTPKGGLQYYFNYEPSIGTIYKLESKVSVMNDNGCVFAGENYRPENDLPVVDMPMSVQEYLASLQKEDVISIKYYELLSILTDDFFNDDQFIEKLIHAFRNSYLSTSIQKNTVRKLLMERMDVFNEKHFNTCFTQKMTKYVQSHRLSTIERMINDQFPTAYVLWKSVWENGKARKANTTRSLNAIYEKDGIVRLSDIKLIDKSITIKKLLVIDPRFTITRKAICKSCSNHHKVGCCDKYTSTNRTSASFINNIKIVHGP